MANTKEITRQFQIFQPDGIECPTEVADGPLLCPRCSSVLRETRADWHVMGCLCGYRWASDPAPVKWTAFRPRYDIDWTYVADAAGTPLYGARMNGAAR